MFDYTKAAISQTIDDLKKFFYYIGIAMQVTYLGYLAYAFITQAGIFAVNVVLSVLSVAYLVFYLIITKFGKDPDAKRCKALKKGGKEAVHWIKRAIRVFTLTVAFIDFYNVKNPPILSVVFTAFMLVGLVLEILYDFTLKIINKRYVFITDGVDMDVDEITKPFKNVGNFFKKMTGQEVAPEKELNKNQLFLKEKVLAKREEKQLERQNEKLQKTEDKQRKKQEEKQLKQSTKAEKALLKAAKKKEKLEKREK